MNAVTLSHAEGNFRALVKRILDDVEPTVVTTESGESIVMLSLDEFNSWQETLYLISKSANAEHLQKSIAEDQAGSIQNIALFIELLILQSLSSLVDSIMRNK
ncbi:MAG: antitoxin [Chloroflexi bacterium]|nr:MAG: antitoxin [Chloroflexota bacterium]